MDPDTDDDKDVSGHTLRFYDQHAQSYWDGTQDHDVTQNIYALLNAIQGQPPFTLLDLGCGPGRDLAAFAGLGHTAIGLDGARNFVEMARSFSGCDVWEQNFLSLDLPDQHFDGIFANASLFHVPSKQLPRILRELLLGLKPNGVLFTSNPHGNNTEGWNGDRFGAFYDLERWRMHLSTTGFTELNYYYRPEGRPCPEQPWLATVWRKTNET
jgi:SAM-dependent methyltransferase